MFLIYVKLSLFMKPNQVKKNHYHLYYKPLLLVLIQKSCII